MGIREQLKKCKTLEEAEHLMKSVGNLSEKAQRRCKKVFSQLPFTKKD